MRHLFVPLLLVLVVVVNGFAMWFINDIHINAEQRLIAQMKESQQLTEEAYYRGIFSACMGLFVPSVEICMDLVSQAYGSNFYAIPDDGFTFPPSTAGQKD